MSAVGGTGQNKNLKHLSCMFGDLSFQPNDLVTIPRSLLQQSLIRQRPQSCALLKIFTNRSDFLRDALGKRRCVHLQQVHLLCFLLYLSKDQVQQPASTSAPHLQVLTVPARLALFHFVSQSLQLFESYTFPVFDFIQPEPPSLLIQSLPYSKDSLPKCLMFSVYTFAQFLKYF